MNIIIVKRHKINRYMRNRHITRRFICLWMGGENLTRLSTIDDRRKLIYKILNFMNSVPILHKTIPEFRKAEPTKYRLLQVADFVCSMELLKIKKQEQRLSESEKKFFYKPQELKKTFFKSVDRKNIHNNLDAEP